MNHKEILEALSGLIIAMFVAMMSSTVVSNALPVIVDDLHGSQTGYTWVVVATMLAMTATTPIWGKLADLFDKKFLVQFALIVYVAGSAFAGLAQSMEMLITARVVTGLGVGGLMSLIQIVIASIVPPRERGRYSGYIGAAFALATVSGPLIGGFVVDSALGWRGCFYVSLPIAVVAFVVLQFKLHMPAVAARRGPVRIDYLGATVLMAGISLLLVWVSLAGKNFAWGSVVSIAMVVGALVLLGVAVLIELKVPEPIIPMELFKDRTITLGTIASVFVGVAMFGATVYLSQYFQMSRGMSPTHAGLMSLCMVLGMMTVTIISGRIIAETGRWKRWLVGGMGTAVIGSVLLSTIDHATPLWLVGLFMAVLGAGIGATQQNLMLAVQNNVGNANLGAASAVVNFFRSMGGSAGTSALGALLGSQVAAHSEEKLRVLIPQALQDPSLTKGQAEAIKGIAHGALSTPGSLPDKLRIVMEAAFGDATGHLFLVTAPCAFLAFLCVCFIKETQLRTTIEDADVAGSGAHVVNLSEEQR